LLNTMERARRTRWTANPAPEPYSTYYANHKPPGLEWIVQSTDGKLNVVPAEAGGLMRRSEYQGQIEQLKAVSQKKASSICWQVYGDAEDEGRRWSP
jgi:hypothetical protein